MRNFEVYPLVQRESGEWSIPDEVLLGIWHQIDAEKKLKDLFYDNSIKTPIEWVTFIKSRGTCPALVVDKASNRIVHIFWLKDFFDVGAWVHHCSLGQYRRGAWETALDYWKTYFPRVKILLGLTPETNELAIKGLKKICKFNIVGPIPLMCNMAHEGKRVSGIVSYLEM